MWALAMVALGGCPAIESPDAGIDAAPMLDARVSRRRDIGIDTGIDPWAPRDASRYDAPYPDLDCDDPAFWAAEADRYVFREIPFSNCYPDIPTFATRSVVRGWGWGDFCLRVHSSTSEEVPIGVTRATPDGVTLDLAAPSEVDLEMRMWAPREDGSWRLVSERGMYWMDPPPPFRLVLPMAYELGRDVLHVNEAVIVTTTEATSWDRVQRRAHGPLLAVGEVFGRIAWVRDETPPVIEILDDDLSTFAEHVWTAPFDPTRLYVLPFGVVSADQLMMLDGRDAEFRILPDVLDEAIADGVGATARAEDRGYAFDGLGTPLIGPTGVARVARGAFLDDERRVLGFSGPIGDPIDPAIGDVIAVEGHVVLGERGFATQRRSGVTYAGVRTHVSEPESEGLLAFILGPTRRVFRRADGVFIARSAPDPAAFCE